MDSQELELLRRNSGISLSADGVFFYKGGAVANPRVQDLFHKGISVREDGEVILSVGKMWAYVRAETVAFFIDHIRVVEGGLELRYKSTETTVSSVPNLAIGPDQRFYLWADEDSHPACLTRAAHQRLANLLEEVGSRIALTIGRVICPLRSINEVPSPDSRVPESHHDG